MVACGEPAHAGLPRDEGLDAGHQAARLPGWEPDQAVVDEPAGAEINATDEWSTGTTCGWQTSALHA